MAEKLSRLRRVMNGGPAGAPERGSLEDMCAWGPSLSTVADRRASLGERRARATHGGEQREPDQQQDQQGLRDVARAEAER